MEHASTFLKVVMLYQLKIHVLFSLKKVCFDKKLNHDTLINQLNNLNNIFYAKNH